MNPGRSRSVGRRVRSCVHRPSDIAAITRQQAEEYFALYYAPNNLTAAIVGDFDQDQALAWAKLYFGRIPAGERLPPAVITLATPQTGELDYSAEVDAPPRATIQFRTTAFNGQDDPALSESSTLFSGFLQRITTAGAQKLSAKNT